LLKNIVVKNAKIVLLKNMLLKKAVVKKAAVKKCIPVLYPYKQNKHEKNLWNSIILRFFQNEVDSYR